jgi:hypothetical protein
VVRSSYRRRGAQRIRVTGGGSVLRRSRSSYDGCAGLMALNGSTNELDRARSMRQLIGV